MKFNKIIIGFIVAFACIGATIIVFLSSDKPSDKEVIGKEDDEYEQLYLDYINENRESLENDNKELFF